MKTEGRVRHAMIIGVLLAVGAGFPSWALAEKESGLHASLESRVRQLEVRMARAEERIADQERRLAEHGAGGMATGSHVVPSQPMGQMPAQQPMQAPAAPAAPMGGGGMTDM
ncbi:hypothetical protein K2X85_08320 [bacterium]|nr:hypothetical protein [bacterium]